MASCAQETMHHANVAANATAKVQHSNLVPHLGASCIIVITCF